MIEIIKKNIIFFSNQSILPQTSQAGELNDLNLFSEVVNARNKLGLKCSFVSDDSKVVIL